MAEISAIHIILLFALLLLLIKLFKSSNPSTTRLPPGPKPWPIVGNLLQIGKDPHVTLAKLAQSFGPLISLRMGTQIWIIGSTPLAAEEIFKTHDRVLSGRQVLHAVPAKRPELNGLSMGWAFDCNDQWKFLRTICKSWLFSIKSLDSQASLREEKVSEMVEYISKMEGKGLELAKVVFPVGFNTLSNIFMSRDFIGYGEDGVMKAVVLRFMEAISSPNLADFYQIFGGFDLQGLQACMKESLRLHPPAPLLLPHRALELCKVMDYTIPKNAQVFVNVWAMGRDPFGAGRKMCPGLAMAAKQVPLIVASLLHVLEWSLPFGKDPTELDMAEMFNLTIRMKQPLVLVPFGARRKMCPGLAMAAKHVPLIVASLLHFFEWSLPFGIDLTLSRVSRARSRQKLPPLILNDVQWSYTSGTRRRLV